MKKIIAISTAPAAIGPYSQAVVHGGLVYVSGQIALDVATGQVIQAGAAAQAERVLENVGFILAAAGSGYDKVLRVTVYLKNMNDFPAVNEVYARFFRENAPARSTVEVARLPKDAAVEMDVIAFVE